MSVGAAEVYLGEQDACSADLITAGDVLPYIGDVASLFTQAARVLRPRGVFALTTEELVRTWSACARMCMCARVFMCSYVCARVCMSSCVCVCVRVRVCVHGTRSSSTKLCAVLFVLDILRECVGAWCRIRRKTTRPLATHSMLMPGMLGINRPWSQHTPTYYLPHSQV
jgi:hypothetical protein